MSALRSAPLHMLAGFLAMGAWAWFANRHHPWPAPALAALTQGAITAVTTGVLKKVVEAVSARVPAPARILAPALAAWGTSLAALTGFHLLARTPELWATIALPNLVATIYAAFYATAIRRG